MRRRTHHERMLADGWIVNGGDDYVRDFDVRGTAYRLRVFFTVGMEGSGWEWRCGPAVGPGQTFGPDVTAIHGGTERTRLGAAKRARGEAFVMWAAAQPVVDTDNGMP